MILLVCSVIGDAAMLLPGWMCLPVHVESAQSAAASSLQHHVQTSYRCTLNSSWERVAGHTCDVPLENGAEV